MQFLTVLTFDHPIAEAGSSRRLMRGLALFCYGVVWPVIGALGLASPPRARSAMFSSGVGGE